MTEEMIVLYDWTYATDTIEINTGFISMLEYFHRQEQQIMKSPDRKVKIESKGSLIRFLVNDIADSKNVQRNEFKKGL